MLISILICSLTSRKFKLDRLVTKLERQIANYDDVEIIIDADNGEKTIGKKRDDLLNKANGKYCCFIDDDDDIAPFQNSTPRTYVDIVREAVLKNPDCVSLIGIYRQDMGRPQSFYHSLKYDRWFSNNSGHYRPPNHLNVIKTSIAKRIGFNHEMNFGEDRDFSMRLIESGLLKTEQPINSAIYYYVYNSKK